MRRNTVRHMSKFRIQLIKYDEHKNGTIVYEETFNTQQDMLRSLHRVRQNDMSAACQLIGPLGNVILHLPPGFAAVGDKIPTQQPALPCDQWPPVEAVQ